MFYGNTELVKGISDYEKSYNNLVVECNNFNKIIESIDILSENNIITEAGGPGIIQRIKDLWGKFVEWVKGIIAKIKDIFRKMSCFIHYHNL